MVNRFPPSLLPLSALFFCFCSGVVNRPTSQKKRVEKNRIDYPSVNYDDCTFIAFLSLSLLFPFYVLVYFILRDSLTIAAWVNGKRGVEL